MFRFVRPQLEYASTAWSPRTRCNIDKIEALQRRAARSVLNDWSHPNTQTPALKELHPYTIGSSSSMLQFIIVRAMHCIRRRRLACDKLRRSYKR